MEVTQIRLPCWKEVVEAGWRAVGAPRETAETRPPLAAMARKATNPPLLLEAADPPPLLEAANPLHRPPVATSRKVADPLGLGVHHCGRSFAVAGVGPAPLRNPKMHLWLGSPVEDSF
jgi:hypothetical protein